MRFLIVFSVLALVAALETHVISAKGKKNFRSKRHKRIKTNEEALPLYDVVQDFEMGMMAESPRRTKYTKRDFPVFGMCLRSFQRWW